MANAPQIQFCLEKHQVEAELSWFYLSLASTVTNTFPVCGLMFALHSSSCVTLYPQPQDAEPELRKMQGTKVINEKTWKHKNETDR